ncbi:MAG: hypothetical protein KatS3mg096_052 [Candidatus Parcubacteria bacterium]|nr:MAG: hypothetical protein KatS3mg096_052 [Candidatus Parcubacteria bacterium]
MEIKKINNYYELVLDGVNFVLDPPSVSKDKNIILTDISKNINYDKIFNSAGEYNVGDVYFWGFSNKNFITYLFDSKEGSLVYSKELSEETLKKIRMTKKEVEALFLVDFFDERMVSLFKPNLILTNKNIKLEKFQSSKGDKLKINLKKVDKLIFVLQ